VSAVLVEKVRAAILPGGRIDDIDPVAELQRLHSRFIEIETATNRLLTALEQVPQRSQAAYRAFSRACESGDAEAIEKTLAEWLAVAPQAEFALREHAAAHAMKNAGSVMEKFKSEFPDAKKILLRASELRLAQAKEQAGIVLAEERARLSPEGFSDSEIRNSTRSKRATGRVKHLEVIQRRIETEPIEAVWKLFAPRLLVN
jgi:hypothetical protein